MDWALLAAILGIVVAVYAAVTVARLNARTENLARQIDENRATIQELTQKLEDQRQNLADQRQSLERHDEAIDRHGAALASAGSEHQKPTGPAVVVYNPTKNADFDYLKGTLARAAKDADLPEPIWMETTEDDPGFGQTREALELGASVVIAAGGDGTVRNVGEVLTGTATPLGMLPVGTGNLLARNLGLPLSSPRRMAVIALTGQDTKIDVGWLAIPEQAQLTPADIPDDAEDVTLATPGEHAFLVNAGIGFDAAIMASADEESDLKSKIGWLAYVKAALPHLLGPKMRAKVTTGKSAQPLSVDARTIMALNCGELLGGFVLDQHADPGDGWLELAVLDTRRGLIGWADVVRQVGLNGLGLAPVKIPGIDNSGEINVHRINQARIETNTAQPVQVDGDVLGYAREISTRVDEAALRVRVG
ncbi:diacylglycerol kinase family enzyme [Trueperella bonasi]|uniref:Diacylglycerol kinase family enzyme n=1 Tax=Trueperella bonasi TaxID=312286 RepID=A0ABT9NHK7_9ACTO|nr:diacylglycerol kinase family protein [Trueperella bonasi]MDP9806283.1 diacylglycerol kinase family enzyme [Trueperella bonasi]